MSGGVLLMDVGNSRLKWRLAHQAAGVLRGVSSHDTTPAATMAKLKEAWQGLPRPRQAWVANVAGAALQAQLEDLIRELWGLTPRFVEAEAGCCGVRGLYRQPRRLGVDRWLAMIAAFAQVEGHCLVVDCGSAVTLDLIDDQGRQRDCVILPGFTGMRRCLLEKTRLAEQDGRPRLAEDTRQAMTRGARLAIAAAVAEMRRDWRASLEGEVALLVTGGDWRELDQGRSGPAQVRPELVLDGLEIVASAKGG